MNNRPFHRVTAGSFLHYENAMSRVLLLQNQDIPAIIKEKIIDGKLYYQIQAGAYYFKENADLQLEAVKEIGIEDAYISSR